MSKFLTMGGYGMYVWPSYGLSAIVMVVILWAALHKLNVTQAQYKRLKAASHEKRKKAEASGGNEA